MHSGDRVKMRVMLLAVCCSAHRGGLLLQGPVVGSALPQTKCTDIASLRSSETDRGGVHLHHKAWPIIAHYWRNMRYTAMRHTAMRRGFCTLVLFIV